MVFAAERRWYHRKSFQRSYVDIQSFYARNVGGDILFAHLEKNRNHSNLSTSQDSVELGRRTVQRIEDFSNM